jgi:hypothetical protein
MTAVLLLPAFLVRVMNMGEPINKDIKTGGTKSAKNGLGKVDGKRGNFSRPKP